MDCYICARFNQLMKKHIFLNTFLGLIVWGFSAAGQSEQLSNQSKIDSLLTVYSNSSSDTAKVSILVNIASEYAISNYGVALDYAHEALRIAETLNLPAFEYKAISSLGDLYFRVGLTEMATHYFSRQNELAKVTNTPLHKVMAINNWTILKILAKDYEAAIANMLEALSILETTDPLVENSALIESRLTLLNNLGHTSISMGRLGEGERYLLHGISIAEKFDKHYRIHISLLINYANSQILAGQLTSAFETLGRSKKQAQEFGDLSMIASAEFYYGMAFETLKNTKNALYHFTQSFQMAEKSGGVILQKEIADKLFTTYEALGVADSALKYLRIKNHFSEQVKLEEAAKTVLQNEMNEKFQALEREYIQESQRKTKRTWLISAMALLAVSMSTFFIRQSIRRLRMAQREKLEFESRINSLSSQTSRLRDEIDQKEKHLATVTLQKIQYDAMLEELAQKIEVSGNENSSDISGNIRNHILKLNKSKDKMMWKEFELRFENIHVGFYQQLHEKFPNLTPNERRICAFLRLNMTTKEIAEVTGKTQHSINIARTRLRKKLDLTNSETGLVEFLASF